ncbi:MAG: phosphoribosylanthranilate isomerase [Dehalococcoidales bacterium]|nr:phosphoribosylanthranilate isomerase [Dehalococcoidales bacterium]
MTHIKICGIKSEDVAMKVADAGADFIGLVFAPSRRQITPKTAAKITAALKKNKARTKSVGVFVNTPLATVRKIADKCGLDWIQLSGDESWAYCRELGKPFIKAIKCARRNTLTTIEKINEGKKLKFDGQYLVLLDTAVKGFFGGTGRTFPWKLAEPIVAKHDHIIIAGGLKPSNVGKAIETLKPWGVDVSSGVETRGVKDMKKIVKFIEAVRQADAM